MASSQLAARLRRVMARLPRRAHEMDLHDTQGVCQFAFSHPDLAYVVEFADGGLSVTEGWSESVDTLAALRCADFLAIVDRKKEMRSVFFGGRGEIHGSMKLANRALVLAASRDLPTARKYARIERAAAQAERVRSVAAVPEVSAATLRAAFSGGGRPCVVRGAFAEERSRVWNPASLAKHPWCDARISINGAPATLGEFLARRTGEELVYTSGVVLPEVLRAALPKIDGFDTRTRQTRLFASSRGVTVPLHRDPTHGLLWHCWGPKRIAFYSPADAPYVYPNRYYVGYQTCAVNVATPDATRHPLFKKARPISIALEAGDLLMIPGGWFHYVENDGDSFSVSIG